MLPKSKRLTRDDFSKIKKRTTIRANYFDVIISSGSTTRFACVITKKRIKLAVDRNKIKRRIYSALSNIKLKSPHFVIIYPKQNALNTSFKTLNNEIHKVFDTL